MIRVCTFLVINCVLLIVSCSSQNTRVPMERSSEQLTTNELRSTPKITTTRCNIPRPEVCSMDYKPVCATRYSKTQCEKIPCEITETSTYSNGCVACSDVRVISYQSNKCN